MYRNKIRNFLSQFDISLRQLYIMYFCVFFLPLLITFLLCNRATNQLESQLKRTGRAMTRQIQTVVDSRMEDVSVLLDQINNNSTIRYLLNRKGTLSAADRYRYLTIINDLRKQYTASTMIEDIFIYMKNTDSIISTRSRSDSRFFYENYYSYEDIDYEEWMRAYLQQTQDAKVLPVSNVYNGVSTKRLITIMQSLPRRSGEYQTGMAVLFIDADQLLSQINPESEYKRAIYVFSEDGTVIVSSNDFWENPIEYLPLGGVDGVYTSQVIKNDLQISYLKSPSTGWTYAMAMSENQFYSPVYRLRALTVGALAVVSAVGIVLIIMMTVLSSIPAKTALEALKNQYADGADYYHRISMRDIGTFVQQAIDDRLLYQERLPFLIESYVYKLMYGSRDVESELALVSEVLGFRFPTNQFAVIALRIEDADDYRSSIREIVNNIGGETAVGMNLYMTVTAKDTISILVSFWAGTSHSYRTLLEHVVSEMRTEVRTRTNSTAMIGVSLVGDNYKKITSLYREALMCLASLHSEQNSDAVFYADIARLVPPNDYSFSLNVEKKLIACVCTGDAVRMNQLLDDIFTTHEQEARMVAGMTQCLKFDMIGTLLRCAQEINRDDTEDREYWQQIQTLMTMDNLTDIYEGMHKAFSSLCNRAYATRNSHNDDMRDKMLEFIQQNYQNPDMGLDMVARAFGIAPSYLSRFFKEQTGGNFLDHVNRLRVEHAAQLLRTTELPFSQIAETCGFSGSQALNRVFNRVLGISPSAYQQLARQGGLDIRDAVAACVDGRE